MSKKSRDPNVLYQAVELVDGQEADEMVATSEWELRRGAGSNPISYNNKPRIYRDEPTARAYKNRLAKEGRVVRIKRFAFTGYLD